MTNNHEDSPKTHLLPGYEYLAVPASEKEREAMAEVEKLVKQAGVPTTPTRKVTLIKGVVLGIVVTALTMVGGGLLYHKLEGGAAVDEFAEAQLPTAADSHAALAHEGPEMDESHPDHVGEHSDEHTDEHTDEHPDVHPDEHDQHDERPIDPEKMRAHCRKHGHHLGRLNALAPAERRQKPNTMAAKIAVSAPKNGLGEPKLNIDLLVHQDPNHPIPKGQIRYLVGQIGSKVRNLWTRVERQWLAMKAFAARRWGHFHGYRPIYRPYSPPTYPYGGHRYPTNTPYGRHTTYPTYTPRVFPQPFHPSTSTRSVSPHAQIMRKREPEHQ